MKRYEKGFFDWLKVLSVSELVGKGWQPMRISDKFFSQWDLIYKEGQIKSVLNFEDISEANNNNLKTKWLPPRDKTKLKSTRRSEDVELKLSQSTSTRFSSKSTQTSESQRRPWTSWTPSSTTPSTESPLKDQSSSDSTREELFHPERFNLPSSSSSPENSPDTPSLKEPRPSPSTSNNDFILAFNLCIIPSFSIL